MMADTNVLLYTRIGIYNIMLHKKILTKSSHDGSLVSAITCLKIKLSLVDE